jgi:hypothetical protein
LAIPAPPVGIGASHCQLGEYVVMRVIDGQVQAEVKASRVQQLHQSRECWLSLVTLIGRDHRDRNPSSFSQFSPAHIGL